MPEFEARIGNWVIRRRVWIFAGTLVLLVLAGTGIPKLHFTNDYRVFFSEDNPELMAFEALERIYTKDDNVFFVLAPKDGNVFTRKTLAAVEWLTNEAWQTPMSTRVDSITNFQHTEAQADDLLVQDLVRNAMDLSDEELTRIRTIALAEPILLNRLVPAAADVTALNITVQFPDLDQSAQVSKVVKHVRNLADQVRERYPHLDVYLSGMVLMNNAFMEASQHDLKGLVLASFIVMIVALGVLLRGIVVTFAIVLTIIFSIVTAMGIGGHLSMPITPPSATAPIIILTIAIAGSVHILISFLYELRHGSSQVAAMTESIRVNLQPVFIASLTTALGFLCMNFSEVPPFRDLGNFVALGVLASFIYAIAFLPALISLFEVKAKPLDENRSTSMQHLAEFVVTRRKFLLLGMGAIIIVLVSFVPRNELNDVFVHYFDERVQFRIDSDFVDKRLGGLYRIDYSLSAGESGGINNPEFLKSAKHFSDWWRLQPETVHVNTFTDFMQRLNKNMHGDDPAWQRLPDNRELAAQYLLLYEMSLPYGLDLNNQINIDKSATRLSISIKTMSTKEVLALEQRASQWLRDNEPSLAGTAGTGTTIMFAHIGKRNIASMLKGTTLALILISLVLIVALRSVKIGLISLLPNLVPAAMGFGLWGLLVGEVGLALSVVTGMTLGIVVDDTVHFLSKYLRARREHGLGTQDSVRYAFNRVGKALWVTSVVLIIGFLVLSFSAFKLNAGMGLLTAIVIAFALMADFLFLPPLLMRLEKDNEQAVTADAAS